MVSTATERRKYSFQAVFTEHLLYAIYCARLRDVVVITDMGPDLKELIV